MAAALVSVVRGLVLGGGALDGSNQRRQVVRGTRDDVRVGVVAQSNRQRVRGRWQGLDDAAKESVGYAAHGHHVGRVPGVRGASTARDTSGGRADQTSERKHGGGPGLVPGDPRAGDLHAEHALGVTLKRGGLVGDDVEAGARQIDERTKLGGDDTGNRQGGLVRASDVAGHGRRLGGGGQLEGQRSDRLGGQRAAHGGEHLVRGLDDAGDNLSDLRIASNLVEGGAPRGGLTGKGQRVGGLIQRGHKRHVLTFLRGQFFSNDAGHRGPLS